MLNFETSDITNFEEAYQDLVKLHKHETLNHKQEIEYLKQWIRMLQKKIFGASADHVNIPKGLFNEIELDSVPYNLI